MGGASPENVQSARTEITKKEYLNTISILERKRNAFPPDIRNEFAVIVGQGEEKGIIFSQSVEWQDGANQKTGLVMLAQNGIRILSLSATNSNQSSETKAYQWLSQEIQSGTSSEAKVEDSLSRPHSMDIVIHLSQAGNSQLKKNCTIPIEKEHYKEVDSIKKVIEASWKKAEAKGMEDLETAKELGAFATKLGEDTISPNTQVAATTPPVANAPAATEVPLSQRNYLQGF